MPSSLRDMEQRAFQLKNAGRLAEAAELLSVVVREQPDWEHGDGLHNLAQCYEDLGYLELAENFYRAALNYNPTSDIFLGGLASFLYLHGNPADAFNAYLNSLTNARRQGFEALIEPSVIALTALGERLGWSQETIAEKIGTTVSSRP